MSRRIWRLQPGIFLSLILYLGFYGIQHSEAQWTKDVTPEELSTHSSSFLSSIMTFIRSMEEIRSYKKLPNTPKNTETKKHLLKLHHHLTLFVIKKDDLIASINDYLDDPTEDNWYFLSSKTELAYEQLEETGVYLSFKVREFEYEEQKAFRDLVKAIGIQGDYDGKKDVGIRGIGRLRHGQRYADSGYEIHALKRLAELLIDELQKVKEATVVLSDFIQKRFH